MSVGLPTREEVSNENLELSIDKEVERSKEECRLAFYVVHNAGLAVVILSENG